MVEVDPLVLSYRHLANLPRAADALHMLKKIASMVKPIMRARGWKVRELTEFYPMESNLLGLNVNHGQKICLRLRYPSDQTLFLPLEQVADTMLHELVHIVRGPHDAKFHALWDQLRDEHLSLSLKGYTGEGFLSQGRQLGGRPIPMVEARREARSRAAAAAVERGRRAQQQQQQQQGYSGSAQRLGGNRVARGEDIRRVIGDAAERRRTSVTRGCANDDVRSQAEIVEIADTATRNGFRTQAEEDAANDAAIAQAMWELVQEDEKARMRDGAQHVPPSGADAATTAVGDTSDYANHDDFHTSHERSGSHGMPPTVAGPSTSAPKATASQSDPFGRRNDGTWNCRVCTLVNPALHLCCDACAQPRGSQMSPVPQQETVIDLTGSDSNSDRGSPVRREGQWPWPTAASTSNTTKKPRQANAPSSSRSAAPAPAASRKTWTCHECGRVRDSQWWSCDRCGTIKLSSK